MRCEQSKSPAKTIESHNAPGAMSNNNISTFDQWHSLSDEICSVPYAAIPSASHTINSSFFPFFHGIPKKSITEIVGLPGTGKTCFAMHLIINALDQSPSNFVFYIDTANNFTLERFNQIYRAGQNASRAPLTDFLERIVILPAVDVYELFMQLTRIEIMSRGLASESLKPVLIIIDNVAAPLKLMPRFSIEKRVKIIGKLTNDLRKLASRYDCAILAVNQLTRKICPNAEPNSPSSINAHYQFVPSLGQTWRKNIDFSIILNDDELKGRYAELSKNNILFEPLADYAAVCGSKIRIKYMLKEEGFIEETVK